MEELNQDRQDVLTELINVGFGHACGAMGEMLGTAVQMEVPTVELLKSRDTERGLSALDPGDVTIVSIGISDGIQGSATLVFPALSAATIIAALSGEDPTRFSDDELLSQYGEDPDDAVIEFGNIVISAVVGAVANGLHERVVFSRPVATYETMRDLAIRYVKKEDNQILFTVARFGINQINVTGNVCMLLQVESVARLMEALDNAMEGLW